jgi:hypothetical protein
MDHLEKIDDQFVPYEDISLNNNFNFYTNSGEFSMQLFNKVFLENQRARQLYYQNVEDERLRQLNEVETKPKLHELTIGKHLINIKDCYFGIVDDLLNDQHYDVTIITKQNRIFYIGLSLMFIFIIYVIMKYILRSNDNIQ